MERMPGDTSTMASSLSSRLEISLPLDKDPFVTPGRGTRLSPTASSFTPYVEVDKFSPTSGPLSNALSSDIGVSRVLRVSSDVPVLISEVEEWLSVSDFDSTSGLVYMTDLR